MKRILVIRKYDGFSLALRENGFQITNLPLVETIPLANLEDFEKRLDEIEIYDGIFLTSRWAAKIFADKMSEKQIVFGGKVYVLGGSSFEILNAEKFNLFFDAEANTAREMLEKIPIEDLKNKRFLFVRGNESLRVVPDFLKELAQVDETIVYETHRIKVGIDKINSIRRELEQNNFAAVCFFSPSAAASFLEQFGAQVLHQTSLATIGQTTAEFFESQNLPVAVVSSKATAADFSAQLIEYLRKDLTAVERE